MDIEVTPLKQIKQGYCTNSITCFRNFLQRRDCLAVATFSRTAAYSSEF